MFFFNDCTGEINLPLRLRCVRCYRFTQWINLVVCLLDYEMMYGRDKSAPTPTVCSLYTFTQWINLVVCLLDYEWCTGEMNHALRSVRWYIFCAINKLYGMFAEYYTLQVLRYLDIFFFNDCRARWICPYACGVFAVIHLRNEYTLWNVCWYTF